MLPIYIFTYYSYIFTYYSNITIIFTYYGYIFNYVNKSSGFQKPDSINVCDILQKLDFVALEETTEYDGGYNRDSRIIR